MDSDSDFDDFGEGEITLPNNNDSNDRQVPTTTVNSTLVDVKRYAEDDDDDSDWDDIVGDDDDDENENDDDDKNNDKNDHDRNEENEENHRQMTMGNGSPTTNHMLSMDMRQMVALRNAQLQRQLQLQLQQQQQQQQDHQMGDHSDKDGDDDDDDDSFDWSGDDDDENNDEKTRNHPVLQITDKNRANSSGSGSGSGWSSHNSRHETVEKNNTSDGDPNDDSDDSSDWGSDGDGENGDNDGDKSVNNNNSNNGGEVIDRNDWLRRERRERLERQQRIIKQQSSRLNDIDQKLSMIRYVESRGHSFSILPYQYAAMRRTVNRSVRELEQSVRSDDDDESGSFHKRGKNDNDDRALSKVPYKFEDGYIIVPTTFTTTTTTVTATDTIDNTTTDTSTTNVSQKTCTATSSIAHACTKDDSNENDRIATATIAEAPVGKRRQMNRHSIMAHSSRPLSMLLDRRSKDMLQQEIEQELMNQDLTPILSTDGGAFISQGDHRQSDDARTEKNQNRNSTTTSEQIMNVQENRESRILRETCDRVSAIHDRYYGAWGQSDLKFKWTPTPKTPLVAPFGNTGKD